MPIKEHLLRWALNRGTVLIIIRRLFLNSLFLKLVVIRRGLSIFSKCDFFRHVGGMNLFHRSSLKDIIRICDSLLFACILFLDLFESGVVILRFEGICQLSICDMKGSVTLGAVGRALYVVSLHVVTLSLYCWWLTHSSFIWQKWKLFLRVGKLFLRVGILFLGVGILIIIRIIIRLIQLFFLHFVWLLKQLLVLVNYLLTILKIIPITFEYIGLIYTTIESRW